MTKWTKEYDNDTGPCDDYFEEWWNVTDGNRIYRCNNSDDADFLIAALAQPERLAELGWQEIDCPICGGGARAFPKPEQEPVAWMSDVGSVASAHEKKMGYVLESAFTNPLYTTPPQRKPLTDDEIIGWVESGEYNVITNDWASHIEFARAIEAAHGIKE